MPSNRRGVRAAAFCVPILIAACGDERDAAPAEQVLASTPRAATGPRFEECAESAGLNFHMAYLPGEQGENFRINLYDHGTAVAAADVDGDGRDDVFFCNQLGPCALFRNLGDFRFADVTRDAGDLASSLDGKIAVGASFADADGDGDEDLYVATTRGGNVYLENLGGGRFRDATKDAGLTLVAESWGPCFFDMDQDGDLDLLVTNTARWTTDEYDAASRYWRGKVTLADLIDSEKEWDVLYRNDGKGHFTDVTEACGMKGKGWGGDVAVFDADGDGDLDVFVCNMFGSSSLYANDGTGRFTEITKTALGRTSWGAVGARAFDYDGDGDLDLFVTDMHSDMWISPSSASSLVQEKQKFGSFYERAIQIRAATRAAEEDFERKVGMKRGEVIYGSTLYRNLGGGRFEEVSDRAGFETWWPWGIAEGDFDSDGYEDAFIPTGMGYPFFYWRPSLLWNRGDGTFTESSRAAGIEPPSGGTLTVPDADGQRRTRSNRAAAVADFDGDGRLDIVVSNFNDRAMLYRNRSAAAHWCAVRLKGTGSGTDAIGAFVTLKAGGRTYVRQVQATGGYLAQSSNTLHFGLGTNAKIDSAEIRWPRGTRQTFQPTIDALTTVSEPPAK
jgi:enediyne biosynthesis protein E4